MQECSNACENVLKTSYKSADMFMPTKITGKIDGADEDVAQKTDHTPPQDDAVTSEPATRAYPTTAAMYV